MHEAGHLHHHLVVCGLVLAHSTARFYAVSHFAKLLGQALPGKPGIQEE